MSFLSLGGLGALWQGVAVAAAAGTVGALVIMYFLKLKRVRREVPSTFLWKRSVWDLTANSPFQRLRKNLLLLLQLLILIAALLALGRLALRGGGKTGVAYIVLIDNSASMGATDVSGGRLAAAARQAKKVVGDMGARDQMMVLSFASRPRVVQTLTGDKRALRAAIGRITLTGERTDISGPLKLAAGLARTVSKPKIIVISDGAFPQGDTVAGCPAPVELVTVGQRSKNLGVTAMDVRRSMEDPRFGEIFAKVTNFFDETLSTKVSLEIDGKLADAQDVSIAPGASHAAIFKVRLDAEHTASVSLEPEDDLAGDDTAWCILEPPKDINVIVVGSISPFLRRSIAAGGRFRISEAPHAGATVLAGDGEPVYVCEGTAPDALGRAGYLMFDAVAPSDGFRDEGTIANPIVLDVDDTHPITAYLELDDLFIAKARKMSFPPETKVLVSCNEGPLVALSYVGGARVLTVTFDPMNSRWPLRISYPMFVANAINFLASGGDENSSRMIHTGDVLVIDGSSAAGKVVVTDPAGNRQELSCEGKRTVAYGDTGQCGVYTVEVGDEIRRYVANLTDSAESDITPGKTLAVGSSTVVAKNAALPENREIWRELLLFAFVVLLLEWYIYNRRVYI